MGTPPSMFTGSQSKQHHTSVILKLFTETESQRFSFSFISLFSVKHGEPPAAAL